MKNIGRRMTALTVAVLMVAGPMVTSCRRSDKKEGEKISADDPWFDATRVELGESYDPEEYDYLSYDICAYCGDYVVVSVDGSRPLPDDFDWYYDDYSAYQVSMFKICDLEGNKVTEIDTNDIISNAGFGEDCWMNIECVEDGGVKVSFSVWEDEDFDTYYAHMDIPSGTLSGLHKSEKETEDSEGVSFEGTTFIGGYAVSKYWLHDPTGNSDQYSYIIKIKDPSGHTTELDMRELFPGLSIFDINCFLGMGNNRVLAPATCSGVQKYFTIDLNGMTVEEYGDAAWLDKIDLYSATFFDDLGCVVRDETGLDIVDFDNHSVTRFMSFDSTYLSVYELGNLEIYECTNDRIVMGGTFWSNTGDYSNNNECVLITLTRADSNPNAGKTVILAADTAYIDEAVAQTVCDFNQTNEDYFIRYDNRYLLNEFGETITDYENVDWAQWELDSEAAMTNQLAMDLLQGDGPDIIFDSMSYSQLNNDDYLMDISDMITGGSYFENILEMSRTEGKLYQMPLTYIIKGIIAPTEDLQSGQTGFTFDEYPVFVDEICNGADPLSMQQIDCFTTLMATVNDSFYGDGNRVDYDNDAFRDMADFVKDHITYIEPGAYAEDIIYDDYSYIPINIAYTGICSFSSYIDSYGSDALNMTLCGIPSFDGRGPSIEIVDSVAISANTASPEGCRAFVESLLSQPAQYLYAQSGYNPVNRDAFDQFAHEYIDTHNENVEINTRGLTPAQIREWGYDDTVFDESVIRKYLSFIDSAGCVIRRDPAVVSIIREEMPAYFEGQKTLDEVIEVLQDRVQTFVNERG